MKNKSLFDFIVSLAARGVGLPLALVANIILARLLGAEEFGRYSTLLSVGLVAGGLATFGVPRLLTREISKHEIGQRPMAVRVIGGWALRFTTCLSVAAMIGVFAWLTWGPGHPPNDWIDKIFVVAIIPVVVLTNVAGGVLQGASRVAAGMSLGNLWKNLILLFVSVALYLSAYDYVSLILGGQVLAFAVAVFVACVFLRNDLFRQQSTAAQQGRSESTCLMAEKSRTWRRSCGHFFLFSACTLILGRLDVVIVNAVAGNAEAGIYAAAARLGQVAALGGMVLMAWLQPRMSRQLASGHLDRVKAMIKRGALASTLMTLGVVVCGWVAIPWIVQVLGSGYEHVTPGFRWLLLGYVVWSVSVPCFAFLLMSGNEFQVALVGWLQVVVTVTGTIALTHYHGAIGAIWARDIGFLLATLLVLAITFKQSKFLVVGELKR